MLVPRERRGIIDISIYQKAAVPLVEFSFHYLFHYAVLHLNFTIFMHASYARHLKSSELESMGRRVVLYFSSLLLNLQGKIILPTIIAKSMATRQSASLVSM